MQKITGLVEDVHEALMGYQVYMPNHSFYTMLTFMLDVIATRYL